MNFRKTLSLLFTIMSACVTPIFAQTYWANQSPAGVTDDIWCVAFANGTFAAVTSQGNLLTSPNGLTWSSQAIDQGVWLVSIAYGNGTWVVVGDNGTVLLSSDLKTWVKATPATTNKLNGVFYTGTVWVAVGEIGTIITSPNAQIWTLQPAIPGVTGFLHGITSTTPDGPGLGGGIWICGQKGVMINGNSTATEFNIYSPNNAPGYAPYVFTQNLEVIISAPALTPTSGQDLVGAGQGILFYSYIAAGLDERGQEFLQSPTTVPNIDFRGLTYGNGYFVAAGEQGTILSSTDGENWTQRFSGDSPSTVTTATLLSAAYSDPLQRFVITGTGGTILVSNSAPTVFGNVSTRGYVSSTQTFIGGFVIEGTAPRTVLIRADGPVLSTFSVPSPLPDPVLTVYNNAGAVIATNTGWTTNTNPTSISAAAQQVGAFELPNPSPDSALLLTLQPGAYTVQITSAKGNSGIALFEAYTN
jgi:hypothetical protein